MKSEDVTIQQKGQTVQCRFRTPSNACAHELHSYADNNPPLGYILLHFGCARRRKGGKKRYVTLTYQHTGNSDHPPMIDWRDWDATLQGEKRLIQIHLQSTG